VKIALAAMMLFGLLTNAQAMVSQADWCRTQSVGLTRSMKTAQGLNQLEPVALQQAGLAPGGPRHRLAILAWQRLEAGDSENAAAEVVRAACMRENLRALLDDTPTFGTKPEGAGAQLCSDLATGLSGYLSDGEAATRELGQALDEFAPREHDDNRPRPRLAEALRVTQQFARGNRDSKAIAGFAMRHCQSLDANARAELDAEFYVR
jgi:hypothetical protein